MAVFTFGKLKNNSEIKLGGGDTLVFGVNVSAADISVGQHPDGVELSDGKKSILLKDYVFGNLSLAEISFDDGSELLVGDTLVTTVDDGKNNTILPTILGEVHRDQLLGLGGDDEMEGYQGADLMHGGSGNDLLDGDEGNDYLDGGRGNDTLYGSSDDDVLKGGEGDDELIGGLGADRMDGGDGMDIYRIEAAHSPPADGQYDKVKQFMTGVDQFDLDVEGSEANYIEKNVKTDDFASAMQEAINLLVQNEGLKDYVFISGKTKGWLFGEFTDDINPDIAVGILNGGSLASLDFSDII